MAIAAGQSLVLRLSLAQRSAERGIFIFRQPPLAPAIGKRMITSAHGLSGRSRAAPHK